MGLRVTTNVSSVNAQRNLAQAQKNIEDSYAKMSSGSRINRAADDAAGLAISEQLKAQVRSARQANRNASDGISMVQTAEGGLSELSSIVVRLREIGMQAASDTVGDTERGMINKEVMQLKEEIQRISMSTKWGTTNLLDGSSPTFDFQVGINNNEAEDRISFVAGENVATLDSLGLTDVDYSSKDGARAGLEQLDLAQTHINGTRANLGALQNRLVSTVSNLGIQEENLSAANSRIRDTDFAQATAEATRNQVLLQTGVSTLAQANQSTAGVMKLIG
jgi:flagellin